MEPFTISGNGKHVRDLLLADDLVDLYIAAHDNFSRVNGDVLNIGGGVESCLSIRELLPHLESTLSLKTSYRTIEWRAHDQEVFVAVITKIRNTLGWRPKVGAETGSSQLLAWKAEFGTRTHEGSTRSARYAVPSRPSCPAVHQTIQNIAYRTVRRDGQNGSRS